MRLVRRESQGEVGPSQRFELPIEVRKIGPQKGLEPHFQARNSLLRTKGRAGPPTPDRGYVDEPLRSMQF